MRKERIAFTRVFTLFLLQMRDVCLEGVAANSVPNYAVTNGGEMESNKARLLLMSAAFMIATGCAHTTVEKGKPIDQAAIKRIVIGKSTRSDVFEILGPPHSMFQGQVELGEAQGIWVDTFFLHGENRYLTTVDDTQYAMLYRFGKTVGTSVTVVVFRTTEVSIRSDELLLLLSKDANIVEDVAYRKETSEKH